MVDEAQFWSGEAAQEAGNEHLAAGRYDEAVTKLEEALREYERCTHNRDHLAYAHVDLAVAYARVGRSADALRQLAAGRKLGAVGAEVDVAETTVRSLAMPPAATERAVVRVRSARFGEGVVVRCRDTARLVRFDTGGERWIAATHLEVLE